MIDCPWAGGKAHSGTRRAAAAMYGINGDSAEFEKLRTDRLNFINREMLILSLHFK
jgi:hypothetical protein